MCFVKPGVRYQQKVFLGDSTTRNKCRGSAHTTQQKFFAARELTALRNKSCDGVTRRCSDAGVVLVKQGPFAISQDTAVNSKMALRTTPKKRAPVVLATFVAIRAAVAYHLIQDRPRVCHILSPHTRHAPRLPHLRQLPTRVLRSASLPFCRRVGHGPQMTLNSALRSVAATTFCCHCEYISNDSFSLHNAHTLTTKVWPMPDCIAHYNDRMALTTCTKLF